MTLKPTTQLCAKRKRKTLCCLRALYCLTLCALWTGQATFASEYSEQFIRQEIERAIESPDNNTSIEVNQDIEVVFDALLARLALYSDDIESIQFDHSGSPDQATLGAGSERITTMSNGRKLIQKIVIFEPPNRFAYFTDMSLSTVSVPIDYSVGYYTFSELASGNIEAIVSVAYKPSSRLTAFLVRLGFSRALSRDFKNAEEYLNSLN